MRVGIIGAGDIGANLARHWTRRGYDVLLSYKRDATQLEALAAELGTGWGTPSDAAAHSEAILLATRWSVIDDLADPPRNAARCRGSDPWLRDWPRC
jgi:8-hydroxy-5-deazaflavin:NADPH oxidoreductase